MVHSHFVGTRSVRDEDQQRDVTKHEGNALWYAGGYLCRPLRKKIEQGNHKKNLYFV